jgi:murein DD-endopeptidase MepM/ murein hydrolase activator NlpD
VRAGSTVGSAGSTGIATGPHLHFEVRLKGAAINPLSDSIAV